MTSAERFFGKEVKARSIPMSEWPSIFISRAWRYFLFTLIVFLGVFEFLGCLALWPIKLFSPTLFRKATSLFLRLIVPGFLCIPFSWNGFRIIASGYGTMGEFKDQNMVILGNHSARIDWIISLFTGYLFGMRVNFVTEAFIMFLPFIGWLRFIVEDMFVFRSFKRDQLRLDANVRGFHESGVKRWVFLCPEGHIADFNPSGEEYIKNCEEFCRETNREPYTMCLTPRYKGLQSFNRIIKPDAKPNEKVTNMSVTMSYVLNGEVLGKPLRDANRVTPDLWTLMSTGLECHIHGHLVDLSSDPALLKDEILSDYHYKDLLLREFYETGSYPEAMPGKTYEKSPPNWQVKRLPGIPEHGPREKSNSESFQVMPPGHLCMNSSLIGQLFCFYKLAALFSLETYLPMFFASLYVMMSVSHLAGELMAKGHSRESLPFEGLLKGILFRVKGIEGAKAKETAKKLFKKEADELKEPMVSTSVTEY